MDRAKLPPVIAALLDPGAYPHPVKSVRLIQTHISYVLLTGRYAYKIKKPVNLGFLDYTTLAKRHYYCQQEVLLNSRLCPEIYLGVVEVKEREGKIAVGAGEKVVEYAVQMVQLPEEGMMTRLLAEGKVNGRTIDRIAKTVARFHQRAATGPPINRYGEPESILVNVRENFDQTKAYIGRTISQTQYERIETFAYGFVDNHPELFQRRIREERIRDCHGDLRSDSICLVDGVCIFDCIEFNERFRYSDVASEVGFLAMDLDYHERPDLSRRFVDAYIGFTGDEELLLLLDFYKCYRAYVRGKVESFKLDEPEIPVEEKQKALLAAQRYFALAESYVGEERAYAKGGAGRGDGGC